MNKTMLNSAVPAAILRKLQLVRQRKMFVQVASGLVAALAVLLAAMGIAMLIDWLATLYDSRWRIVLTALALSFAACTSIGWIIIAWRRARTLQRVAAEVDQQVPRLEERWTTMTRLGEDAAKPEVIHPAMLRRVSMEAASWEPRIEPENVVSMSTLIRAMLGLTAVTAVLAVALVLNTREMSILARRFWLPTSSISATTLVDVPGNLVIARGEPLALNAAVEGTPVQNAILFLQADAKPAQAITLVADRSEPIGFSHRMRSVEEPFAYRFRAGDGQTEWFNVNVADRPEIDRIKLIITPPAYTKQKSKTFDKLPDRVSALRNSKIEVAVRAKVPVDSVVLNLGNNKHAQLSLGSDGWYRWTTNLSESVSISPTLTEQHGLTNRRSPKCQLIAYEDQPPVVKVLAPDDKTAVRPDDKLEITFSATDDTGIGTAELVVYSDDGKKEPSQLATIPIDLGDQQGARAVQQTVELDLKKFSAKDGTELSYEIRVREDRGDGQVRIASRPPGSDATAKKSEKVSALPATRPQTEQVATAGANNQSQNAETPSNQNAPNATGKNDPKQANSSSSPATAEQSPAKPDAAALAANAKPMVGCAQTPGQPPRTETPTADSKGQTAATRPSGANQPTTAAPSNPKSPGDPKAMTAESNPQSPANPKSAVARSTPQSPGDQKSGAPNNSPQSAADRKSTTANNSPQSPGDQKPATANNSPQSPADQKAMVAKNTPQSPTMPQGKNPGEPPAPRTATTGRQSILTNSDPTGGEQPASASQANNSQNANSSSAQNAASPMKSDIKPEKPANPNSQANNGQPAMKKDANSEKSTAAANPNQTAAANKNDASKQSPSSQGSQSTPPLGDDMTRRSLDVAQAQTGSSQRMKLKVDQWAGSFEGQRRAKLEMAIEPELEALDQKLAKAQRTARGVLDGLAADPHWMAAYDPEVTSAEQLVVEGKKIIDKLIGQSKETPYAFVGLQLADVGVAHLEPARSSFWSAIQSKGDDRKTSVEDGWQHLGRARQLLADLRGQFERSKREFKLAESVEKVKKMYQVYLENSQALLEVQDKDPTRYGRKIAEFNVDEEYLKRLKEVLEMRRDLQAELARILGDDPRLLRRFMDNLRERSHNMREQLADLASKQETLNREVRAWSSVSEADRARMAQLLLMRNVQEATQIATTAGELQDRYQSWLPLQRESKDASLAAVGKKIQEVATAAGELNSRAQNFVSGAQQPVATPAEAPATAEATTPAAKPQAAAGGGAALDQMISGSEGLYANLTQLEVALRQIAGRDDQTDVATFAANRLVDTHRLITDTSAWLRQIRAHKAGSYTGAAEVTQYRLAMKTDGLAGKLGNLEQQLAGMLQRNDGKVPDAIAAKSREFIATLDKAASPNQLAAVYALHGNQLPRANERQQAAGTALVKAEQQYDELMKLTIKELDKLPVQDPIASLLEDPTLDELLAQLEREIPLAELLGIPERPSNLQIVNDWMRPGNNGSMSAWQRMVLNQMNKNGKQTQDKLKQAYQRAIARALKEVKPKQPVAIAKSTKLSDWNKLVSHLGDDLSQGRDKAPPEQYRRAIEQYFAQISREVAEQEKQSP